MLKPYQELRKIDIKGQCDKRKGKNEKGETIDIYYLNWAKMVDLLYENGATKVRFRPLKNTDGTFLFPQAETSKTSNGVEKKTHSYFVSVEVNIDGEIFTLDHPLLNGYIPVDDEGLNQLRINNAIARAYVKCVGLNTGLGWGLWADDITDEPMREVVDDLSIHNIYAIKQRLEEKLTAKLKAMPEDELYKAMGIGKSVVSKILVDYTRNIGELERVLDTIK